MTTPTSPINAGTAEDLDLRAECARIDAVVAALRAQIDPEAWRRVEHVMALTIALYRAGLGRAIDHAHAAGASEGRFAQLVDGDPLLGQLLRIHGLHPLAVEQRILSTIARLRTDLGLEDTELFVLAHTRGVLELRASAAIRGSETLICRALEAAVPELRSIEIVPIAMMDEPPTTGVERFS